MKHIPNFYKKIIALAFFAAILSVAGLATYSYADYYSWTPQTNLGAKDFKAVVVAGSSQYMYAIESSYSQYMYMSVNSGASWVQGGRVNTIDMRMTDIASSADGRYIIIGTYEGYTYLSSDYGYTWSSTSIGGIGPITSVVISDDGQIMYVTTSGGGFYKSINSGVSVEGISVGSYNWNYLACSANCSRVYVASTDGYILRSEDRFSSSVGVSPGGGNIRSIDTNDDGSVVVVGAGSGHVFLSTDAGSYWDNITPTPDVEHYWTSISLSDDGQFILVSRSDGFVYTSYDQGESWSLENSINLTNIQDVSLSSSGQRAVLVSSNSYIFNANDDIAPNAPGTPDLVNASDSGVSNSDNITNDYTPTFAISGCESGATVTLMDNTNIVDLGDAICVGGSVNITSSVIIEQLLSIKARQTDRFGNVSELSDQISVTIDTSPPGTPDTAPNLVDESDSGVSNSDDITNDTTPTFTGIHCDNSGLVRLYASGTLVGSASCIEGYTVTSSSLSDGSYSMTVMWSDTAGNESVASAVLNLTIDTNSPDLSSITPDGDTTIDNVTDASDVSFTVNEVLANGNITITRTGGSVDNNTHVCSLTGTALEAGNHTIDLSDTVNGCTQDVSNLVFGAIYTFEFSMTDFAGNEPSGGGAIDVLYLVDTVAPTISEITPVPSSTNDTTPDYTFSSDEAGTINYGGTCTGDIDSYNASEGSNTITFDTLSPGSYSNCTITVTDASSNVSNILEVPTFAIDITPPDAPAAPDLAEGSDTGVSNEDNITNDNTPTFTGACIDGDTVYLYSNQSSSPVGSYTCSAETTYNVTSSSLANGGHDMSIILSDPAGNTSTASTALTITIDTTAPTTSGAPDLTSDSGVSSSDNITSGPNQVFAGSCTNGNTVQIYDDGASSGSSAACSGGAFSLTSGTLATGVNAITFKETDTAGNVSSASTPLSVTIDTTAPTISSVSSDKANGSYTVGEVIDIDVTFSESVQSAGNVTVTLETGTTDRTCTFSVSSATTGTCNYTVEEGDSTLDLTVSSISGTIRDIAGNSLSNFTPATNLAVNKALVINTSPASTDSGGFSSTQTVGSGGVTTSSSNQFQTTLPTLNIASTTIQLTTATTTSPNIITVINAVNPIFTTQTQQATLQTQKQLFTNSNGTPFTFTKTLTTTSPQNTDIQKLQVFLNSTGYTVSTTGPGSYGLETNKFGPATRTALLKFQKAVGIKGANGIFGPATRAYVNGIIQSTLKGAGR